MKRVEQDLKAEFSREVALDSGTPDELIKAFLSRTDRDVLRRFKLERAQAMKEAEARSAGRRRSGVRVKGRKVEPVVFSGSISGLVTPAYNYEWDWYSSSGRASGQFRTADRSTGDLKMDAYLGRKGSAVDLRTAVGFYFRPITTSGIFRLDASPAYSMELSVQSAFSPCKASAWLGLFIGEYVPGSNTYVGAVSDTRHSLGSVSSSFGDSSMIESSSGYGLSVSVPVDHAHWYMVWVWAGVRASVGRGGLLNFNGASASLDVNVPSMIWTLY